jgi:hypothetical protein
MSLPPGVQLPITVNKNRLLYCKREPKPHRCSKVIARSICFSVFPQVVLLVAFCPTLRNEKPSVRLSGCGCSTCTINYSSVEATRNWLLVDCQQPGDDRRLADEEESRLDSEGTLGQAAHATRARPAKSAKRLWRRAASEAGRGRIAQGPRRSAPRPLRPLQRLGQSAGVAHGQS